MSEAMKAFIENPQEYADRGFESYQHLACNLVTVFGWDYKTATIISEALFGENNHE